LTTENLARNLKGAAARGEGLVVMVGVKKDRHLPRNLDYLWRVRTEVGFDMHFIDITETHLVGLAPSKNPIEYRKVLVRLAALTSCSVSYHKKADYCHGICKECYEFDLEKDFCRRVPDPISTPGERLSQGDKARV
jgi:hypothetical protein